MRGRARDFYAAVMNRTYRLLAWLIAAGYGMIALAEMARHLPVAAALPLAAAVAVPVGACRSRPVAAFAVAWAVAVLCVAVAPSDAVVAVLPLAYPLAEIAATRRTATAAGALAAAAGAALATALPDFQHRGGTVLFALLYATVWTAGYAVGMHRRYTARLLEHSVVQERMRIARELHDVVAHQMSVITVQAGFGSLVIDQRPEEARTALNIVESTGRDLLAELRSLLGVLRDPGDQGAREPAPGLADLDRLVEQMAKAGVQVEITVDGPLPPLPAGVDLSAYRIVQEALTNVVRHAGTGTAHVTIGHRPDGVYLEITDPGRGGPAEPGHGLIGMRERVALFGGTLEAGSRSGGGFRVAALLPMAAT
jgi:signal transduction histidine kinase